MQLVEWDRDVLGVVDVEEVRVEYRLDETGNDRDGIEPALSEVTVQPVRDVEGSVCAKREKVVCRDRLGLACSLQHEELWQNGDGFQPY